MTRFLVASVIVLSLSSIAGCASRAKAPVAPSETTIDEAWVPRDAADMKFEEASPPTGAQAKSEARVVEAAACHPNAQAKPTIGAVHAAVQ